MIPAPIKKIAKTSYSTSITISSFIRHTKSKTFTSFFKNLQHSEFSVTAQRTVIIAIRCKHRPETSEKTHWAPRLSLSKLNKDSRSPLTLIIFVDGLLSFERLFSISNSSLNFGSFWARKYRSNCELSTVWKTKITFL